MKWWDLISFLLVNKILNELLATEIYNDYNMSIYKRYSDKTKRKYSPVPNNRPPSLLIFGFFVGSLLSYLEPPFIDI